MECGWYAYQSKSGQTLFFFNKITGQYKWLSCSCTKNLEPWVPEDNALKAITSEVIEHDRFNDAASIHVRSIATETDLPAAQKILKSQGTQTECLDGISFTDDTLAQNVLSTVVLKNGHHQKVFVEDNSKSVLSRSTSLLPENDSNGKRRDKENCKLPRPSAEPKHIPKVKLFDCSYCEKAFTSYAFLVKHEKYHVEHDIQMKVCDDLDENTSKDSIFPGPNAEEKKTDQDSQSLNDATKQNTVFSALIDTPPSSEADSVPFSQVCFQCGKNFTSSDEFDAHLQEHLKENFCNPCQKSYKNLKQFLKHIGSFHLTRRHKCHICNRKYLLKSSVGQHVKHFHKVDHKEEVEKGSYLYKCGSCKSTFKLSDKLMEHHEVMKHKGTEYQCHECGKLCTDRSIILQHITQEHKLDPQSTSSNLPNSTYERPSRLRECRAKKESNSDSVPADEEGKSTKRYRCHKCNISYTWFNDFVKHRVKKKCCMDKPQVKMNGSRKQYICRYDDKVFDDKKLFAKHYIRHFKSRKIVPPPHSCDQCTETFPTFEALECHFVDHLEEESKGSSKGYPNTFPCEICGKCFGSKKNCRRHFRRSHAKKKRGSTVVNFSCDICSKGFYHRTNLANHRKVHLVQDTPLKFIKEKAQQVTETTTNTAANPQTNQQQPAEINAKGNGMDRKFKCSKCQRKFFNLECLSRHKKLFNHGEVLDLRSSHVSKTETSAPPKSRTKALYNCTLCKKSFKYYNVFYKHRAAHKGERVRECKVCGKDFKTRTSSSHTCLSCKNLPQKKIKDLYTCKVCGKEFLGSRSLKSHMKAHNTGHFDCNSCSISFSCEERLKKHMKNHKSEVNNLKNFKHCKGKLHECSKCGRLYAGRKNLVRHRKICLRMKNNQAGSSPVNIASSKNCVKKEDQKKSDKKCPVFSCQFCQKSFSLFGELYSHCFSVHGEKPCCKCDKLMSCSGSMKRHLTEKHTQDHSFYCHFCSEEFYNLDGLLNHITHVPGVKKHKCSECGQTYSLCCGLMDHVKVHAKT